MIRRGHAEQGISAREKERSVLISLIVDFILFLPDIAAAFMASSVTLFADVLKCLNELVATFFSWLTLRTLSRGKDPSYDYGLGKLENLVGIIVAGIMLLSFAFVFYGAIHRIRNPERLHEGGVALAFVLMTIGVTVNSFLWWRNRRLAAAEHSPIMESQWRLFRAKAVSDGSVLLVLVASLVFRRYAWSVYIDPAASFVIAAFILFSVYGVVSSSLYDLLDKTLEESLQLVIVKELVSFFDEYAALNGVRSRRSGNMIYVEIFLAFDKGRNGDEIHATVERMKTALEARIHNSSVSICLSRVPVS